MFFFSSNLQSSVSKPLANYPTQQALPQFIDSINNALGFGKRGKELLHKTFGIENEFTLRSVRKIIYDHPPIKTNLNKVGKELTITQADAVRILLAKRMTILRIPLENRIRVLSERTPLELDSLLEYSSDTLKEAAYSSHPKPQPESNSYISKICESEQTYTLPPRIKTLQKSLLSTSPHEVSLEWESNALPCSPELTLELLESLLKLTQPTSQLSNESKDILAYARKRLLPT